LSCISESVKLINTKSHMDIHCMNTMFNTNISGITKFKMSAKSKMAEKIHVLVYNSEFISRINTQDRTWKCMVSIQCYMYNKFRENEIING
jgi:hypothetical protein